MSLSEKRDNDTENTYESAKYVSFKTRYKVIKKIILLASSLILFLFTTFTAFAHPGRTDSAGGHWNHSTGEYHYHHGYPEHQHPNGICPYRINNSTSSNISSTTENTNNNIPSEDDSSEKNINKFIFTIIFVAIAGGLFIYYRNQKKS